MKPDVHILRYVREATESVIGEGAAIYLLEEAARVMGESARSIDVAIWHRGAGRGSDE